MISALQQIVVKVQTAAETVATSSEQMSSSMQSLSEGVSQQAAVAEEVSTAKLQSRIGATMQVLVDSAPAMGRKGGVGRTYADAPEIDGTVRLLPPEKISKTLKAGDFTRARIVGTQGHDLVGVPI